MLRLSNAALVGSNNVRRSSDKKKCFLIRTSTKIEMSKLKKIERDKVPCNVPANPADLITD